VANFSADRRLGARFANRLRQPRRKLGFQNLILRSLHIVGHAVKLHHTAVCVGKRQRSPPIIVARLSRRTGLIRYRTPSCTGNLPSRFPIGRGPLRLDLTSVRSVQADPPCRCVCPKKVMRTAAVSNGSCESRSLTTYSSSSNGDR